ncbi:unnamed protein product [Prorocentrum cordatum]|uniref:Uncharacterized protein n=1 Tax=Prorocentrum cordatum TaxID=2364126 RepID=A0ABN9V304_9DINO|nr:unnamed protein product [Polarella glacialis]
MSVATWAYAQGPEEAFDMLSDTMAWQPGVAGAVGSAKDPRELALAAAAPLQQRRPRQQAEPSLMLMSAELTPMAAAIQVAVAMIAAMVTSLLQYWPLKSPTVPAGSASTPRRRTAELQRLQRAAVDLPGRQAKALPKFAFRKRAKPDGRVIKKPAAQWKGIGSSEWVAKKLCDDSLGLGVNKFTGPREFNDFGDWPRKLIAAIFKPTGASRASGANSLDKEYRARADRFVNLHAHGHVVHSYYSGMLTEVAALRAVGSIMHQSDLLPRPSEWLVVWNGCDNNPTSQQVALQSWRRPLHYWSSLQHLVPAAPRKVIKSMRPRKDADVEVRAKAFHNMRCHIDRNKSKWFCRDSMVERLIHGTQCFLAWEKDDPNDPHRPLTAVFGGFSCQPFCPAGGHLKEAHDASEPYSIFESMNNQIQTDFIHLENSHLFDENVAIKDFGKGRWIRFARIFISGGLAATAASLLPENPTEVKNMFLKIFGGVPGADVGDLIGKDAPEKIYAARVNFKQSSRTMIDDDIMHHLTGTNKFRMQQCMKLVATERRGSKKSEAMCVDLSQNPRKRFVAMPYFPSAGCNHEFIAISNKADKKCHVFTHSELNHARGWPSTETESNAAWRNDIGIAFEPEGMTINQSRRLHGNAINLPVLSAWYLFVMSHSARSPALPAASSVGFSSAPAPEACDDLSRGSRGSASTLTYPE